MGDFKATKNVLLASDGDDYDLLKNEEKDLGDISRLIRFRVRPLLLRYSLSSYNGHFFGHNVMKPLIFPFYVLSCD